MAKLGDTNTIRTLLAQTPNFTCTYEHINVKPQAGGRGQGAGGGGTHRKLTLKAVTWVRNLTIKWCPRQGNLTLPCCHLGKTDKTSNGVLHYLGKYPDIHAKSETRFIRFVGKGGEKGEKICLNFC